MRYPAAPNNIGKRRVAAMPDRKRVHFTITDEIHIKQSDAPKKLIYLQKLTFADGRVELRLGYYIIGKKKRMRGRWGWGQYATWLPVADFKRIVRRAKRLDWF